MKSFDLAGKTFLITGASSGIGRQTAITVTNSNGSVVITGRNREKLEETFSLLSGDRNLLITANLSNIDEVESMVNQVPEINGIVHCAGITGHMPAKFIKPAHIEEIFMVNFKAPVLITANILKQKKLLSQSSIVFLSSITTQRPYYGGSVYVSSKSALEGYSKVLSIELAQKGIRSNCISPGYVRTAMIEKSESTVSKESMERIEKMQLLGPGETNDVANAILYLLSDAARWVTGTNLVLGG